MSSEALTIIIALSGVLIGALGLGIKLLLVMNAVSRELTWMKTTLDHRGPIIGGLQEGHQKFRSEVFTQLNNHETRITVLEKP